MVPAPAGHIALPFGGIAAAAFCSSGSCPRSAGTARSMPAGSAAQSRSEPEAPPASSPALPGGRRGAAMRTFPTASLAAAAAASPGLRLRSRPDFSAAAGGSGRSARRRLRARRPSALGSARARRRVRGHVPARARPPREEAAVEEARPSRRGEPRKLYLGNASGVHRRRPPAAGRAAGGSLGVPGLRRGGSRALAAASWAEGGEGGGRPGVAAAPRL